MQGWENHLIIAPILLPLVTAALLLFYDERRRVLKATLSLASTSLLFVIAIMLVNMANQPDHGVIPYLLGNWPAPYAIVLVLDRFSAMMVLLSSILALASLCFSLARWHKSGPYYHTLFQFLLMGVNGAFLTGDLFNLFVFFEVLLAASYGLVLYGSGGPRVKAGLHYIAINLAASSLFLIGVSMIYGVTGTLNMADLAQRITQVPADDLMFLQAGGAILGTAFLVKAGAWPLNFWLPTAYTAAAAPVAAMFAIMTKVGIYVLLRLSLLFFGELTPQITGFGDIGLFYIGLATIAFGLIGVLASQAFGRIAGYSVLVSSGTLLAAIGTGNVTVTGAALFYLVSSTLTIAAFFLLIELVERGQDAAANVLAVTIEAYGEDDDEEEEDDEGAVLPATLAILGTCFAVCAILLIGLPPFSGFVAKIAILSALFNPGGMGTDKVIASSTWLFVGLIVFSGVSALIAMSRSGIRTFWASMEGNVPRVLVIEVAPVVALLVLCLALTVQAGPVMRYMDATAQSLHSPQDYIENVLHAKRVSYSEGAAQAAAGGAQ